MLVNYSMLIDQMNDEPLSGILTPFNMNTVVENARMGNTALLEQLYQATKVRVVEYHIIHGNKFTRENWVCTPRYDEKPNATTKILRKGHTCIPGDHNAVVKYLANWHNQYSGQTHMGNVSIEEIERLYYDATQNPTM